MIALYYVSTHVYCMTLWLCLSCCELIELFVKFQHSDIASSVEIIPFHFEFCMYHHFYSVYTIQLSVMG